MALFTAKGDVINSKGVSREGDRARMEQGYG
jgi:hypothetical protein